MDLDASRQRELQARRESSRQIATLAANVARSRGEASSAAQLVEVAERAVAELGAEVARLLPAEHRQVQANLASFSQLYARLDALAGRARGIAGSAATASAVTEMRKLADDGRHYAAEMEALATRIEELASQIAGNLAPARDQELRERLRSQRLLRRLTTLRSEVESRRAPNAHGSLAWVDADAEELLSSVVQLCARMASEGSEPEIAALEARLAVLSQRADTASAIDAERRMKAELFDEAMRRVGFQCESQALGDLCTTADLRTEHVDPKPGTQVISTFPMEGEIQIAMWGPGGREMAELGSHASLQSIAERARELGLIVQARVQGPSGLGPPLIEIADRDDEVDVGAAVHAPAVALARETS